MAEALAPGKDPATLGSYWWARLEQSKCVYERVEGPIKLLKDALRGKFPALIPGVSDDSRADAYDDAGIDQVNVNVSLRVTIYLRAQAYDEFPTLKYPRVGDTDETTATMNEWLIERVMDHGDAVVAWRNATTNLMTSGSGIVWQGIDRRFTSRERLRGVAADITAVVDSIANGAVVDPQPGMDFQAAASLARSYMLDEKRRVNMPLAVLNALMDFAHKCDVQAKKQIEEDRHARTETGDIWYEHTPIGTWFRCDPTVWDRTRSDWMARRIVLTVEEFDAECGDDKTFKASMKSRLRPKVLTSDVSEAEGGDARTTETMNEQIDIWEVWCRSRMARYYVAEGVEETLENDSTYPYLDINGRPLIKGFYPCTWVVAIEDDSEEPERVFGQPVLWPGWPLQVELIKTRSAYVAACKRTGRVYVVAAGVDGDTIEELKSGKDGVVVRAPVGLRPGEKVCERLDIGQAPVDLLQASQQIMYDYAQAVGVSLPSLTGQPVADTLGQEQIATQATGTSQGDMLRQLERGFAHTAEITRALIRGYFPRSKVAGFVGAEYVTPKQDETGAMTPAPFDGWKASSLDGDKLEATLASRQRGEDPVRIKQIQDFIALLMTQVDGMGLPRWDTEPFLVMLAKSMNMGRLKKYAPSKAELAAMFMRAQGGVAPENGAPGPRGGKNERGGEDGRTARGGRGPGAVPGRQERGRDPTGRGQLATRATRP